MSASRIEKLESFLAESPGDPFLLHALALEHIKAGAEEKAEGLFEQNRRDHPEYVATYYHLGKLLERRLETDKAMLAYDQGMTVARAANDMHTFSELRAAADDLL